MSLMDLDDLILTQELGDPEIEQIIQYSQTDPNILKFTSDSKRFSDLDTFKNWHAQGKIIYLLLDREKKVLGLIWFSKKSLPNKEYTLKTDPDIYTTTFAIRIYGEARGQGLSYPFFKKVYEQFGGGNLWLETSIDNEAAVHLYKKLGFIQISNPDENGKIVMRMP